MTALRAFNNDPSIKAAILERLSRHLAAQEVQAIGVPEWENGKGSLSGCLAHSADPLDFERELGMPRAIAALLDCLYAVVNPPTADYSQQPVLFLQGVASGADLTPLPALFIAWLLDNPQNEFMDSVDRPNIRLLIQSIVDAHHRVAKGDVPAPSAWAQMRREAMAISDSQTDLPATDGNRRAAALAEVAAWPSVDSLTVVSEVLDAHMDIYRFAAQQRATDETGWSDADEQQRQLFLTEQKALIESMGTQSTESIRKATGSLQKDPRFSPSLAKMWRTVEAYGKAQPPLAQRYWEAIRRLASEASRAS